MHRVTLCSVITALAMAAGAPNAQSHTAPPIKPGLWQVHSEREVDGQKVPGASERMKNISPEKRQHFEAMMKQHGVDTDADGVSKVCYTRQALERSPWAGVSTDCKATFSTQTASAWKWHTTCPKSGYEADGEASFLDSENYRVQSTSVSKAGDKVRTSRTTMTAKWQGSDCGGIQPLDVQP